MSRSASAARFRHLARLQLRADVRKQDLCDCFVSRGQQSFPSPVLLSLKSINRVGRGMRGTTLAWHWEGGKRSAGNRGSLSQRISQTLEKYLSSSLASRRLPALRISESPLTEWVRAERSRPAQPRGWSYTWVRTRVWNGADFTPGLQAEAFSLLIS